MTDKEERIFIRKGTARELCKFIYRDGCAGEMHCCSCDISIPRSEAIDKISHALCTQVHGPCETCEAVTSCNENHCNDYRTYAEAALNALLEDK